MAEHIIDIDHITKRFGDNTIINDLSLSVEQGEVLFWLVLPAAEKVPCSAV